MQDLIVLGIVPGTHLQIGFYLWLAVFGGAVTARLMYRERHSLRAHVLSLYVAWLIKRRQLAA